MNLYKLSALFAAILALGGCSQKAIQSKESVERGVIEYLKNRKGLDVTAMDVTVANVSFREKEAEATVSFSAKGAKDASNAMQMRYVLEQQGDKWVVKGRSGDSDGHGGATQGAPAGGALPPGHPPAGSKP